MLGLIALQGCSIGHLDLHFVETIYKGQLLVEYDWSHAQKEEYIPRPRWQVWGARIALAVFIVFLILYYLVIFRGV